MLSTFVHFALTTRFPHISGSFWPQWRDFCLIPSLLYWQRVATLRMGIGAEIGMFYQSPGETALFILSLCRTHALITLTEVSSLGEIFRKKDAVNVSRRLFLQRNTSFLNHFLQHCTTWFASAVRGSVAPLNLCGYLFWYVHGERRVCTCSSQSCSTLGGSWTFAQLGRDRSFPPAPLFIYFSVGRWQCWWFLLSWIYVKSLFAAAQRSQHVAWAQADQVPWLNQFLREGVS